jgi:pyrroloquinoline quinone biosynthesis protein B
VRVKILGSAAGGGFPQWNCGCSNCSRLRLGKLNAVPRSQIQVALTSDNQHWFLLNASPDLRTQIEATPELHPRALRDTPIAGVVLTTGDLDQVLGLLLMRELQPIRIHATDAVRAIVQRENAFFNMLAQHEAQSRWHRIDASGDFTLAANGSPALHCRPVPLGSGYPAWAPPALASQLPREEAVLGLVIQQEGSGRRLGYFPSCGKVSPDMLELLESCDVLLFDGTFWSDDELIRIQGSESNPQTAQEMGHVPVSSEEGSLVQLAGLRCPRKIYVHINNTNPMLNEAGPEYRQVREAGWEIAEDGWEFDL